MERGATETVVHDVEDVDGAGGRPPPPFAASGLQLFFSDRRLPFEEVLQKLPSGLQLLFLFPSTIVDRLNDGSHRTPSDALWSVVPLELSGADLDASIWLFRTGAALRAGPSDPHRASFCRTIAATARAIITRSVATCSARATRRARSRSVATASAPSRSRTIWG
jgi:hypothetical protein